MTYSIARLDPARESALQTILTDAKTRRWLLEQGWKLGVRHDLEDCVQEALLSAWIHRDQWDGRAAVRTWLWTIVRNAVRMRLRAAGRVRRGGGQVALSFDDELALSADADPERTLLGVEAERLVERALTHESPTDKALLKGRVEGQPLGSLARTHGVTETAVKARLFRLRRRLERVLTLDESTVVGVEAA